MPFPYPKTAINVRSNFGCCAIALRETALPYPLQPDRAIALRETALPCPLPPDRAIALDVLSKSAIARQQISSSDRSICLQRLDFLRRSVTARVIKAPSK